MTQKFPRWNAKLFCQSDQFLINLIQVIFLTL